MQNKLSVKEKTGYGIASVGDATMYSVLAVFTVFYLTTVAGISPGTAGSIAASALFVSAIATFFIGYISDNSKFKSGGRRRPFIKMALPVVIITFIGFFTTTDFSQSIGAPYYAILAVIFWVAYCTFFVPYNALGAELTDDYDERSSLRAYAGVGTQTGNFISTVLPMVVVGALAAVTGSDKVAWSASAVIFIGVSALTIIIMLISTKGRERVIETAIQEKKTSLIREYRDVIKAKPTKFLLVAIVFYMIVNTVFTSNLTFFVTGRLQLDASKVSFVFAVITVLSIAVAPLINFVAVKTDKRKTLIIFFLIASSAFFICRFIGVDSMTMLIVIAIIFVIASATYWQLIAALVYDVAEVIELKNGRRVEGTLSSLQSFTQQIGSAIANLILGWSLQIGGFDQTAATQTDAAISAIEIIQTIIPAVCLLVAAVFIILFPLNKKTYKLVKDALDSRKETGSFSKEGLERIL